MGVMSDELRTFPYRTVFLLLLTAILLFRACYVEALPRVSIEIREIKKTNDGFLIIGHVEVANLNDPVLGDEPEKQAGDFIEVIVDILEPGGTFNVLPEWYSIGAGSLMVGDRQLSQEEAEGVNCIHISGWSATIRSIPNPTTNPKPEHFSTDFNFTIPAEHESKMVRIRATLSHTITDTWPYISYWHSIGYTGQLKEVKTGSEEGEESGGTTTSVSEWIERIRNILSSQGKAEKEIIAILGGIAGILSISTLLKHRKPRHPRHHLLRRFITLDGEAPTWT